MALAGRAAQCRQPRAAGAGRHSKSAWLAGWLLTGSPRRHGDKPGSVKSETSTSNQLSSSGNQTPCTIFGILGYPGISLGIGNRDVPGITFQKNLSQEYSILIPNSIFLVWYILDISQIGNHRNEICHDHLFSC